MGADKSAENAEKCSKNYLQNLSVVEATTYVFVLETLLKSMNFNKIKSTKMSNISAFWIDFGTTVLQER